MKPYFIFALVLTVVYLVYYTVIIMHDLYGKKGREKSGEEVFDLGAPDNEESVAVTENEAGFNIGGEQYETDAGPDEPVTGEETAVTGKEKAPEETPEEKLARLKAKAEERMEEITPYLSDSRTADEMYKAILSKGKLENRPDMAWQPIKDKL